MTKTHLQKNWQTIFSRFYLIRHNNRQIVGAWYNRKYHPKAKAVLMYLPEKNDFFVVEQSEILATIKEKKYCQWCERLLTAADVRHCTALDCNYRNKQFLK